MRDQVRGRLRLPGRPPTRLFTDTVIVGAACVVVGGLSGAADVGGALPQPVTGQVLTLLAAIVAAGAAALGGFAARLTNDPRPRWIAAALALYAVVVLPLTVSVTASPDLSVSSARLVAYLLMIGMLVAAIRPPPRVGTGGTWAIAAAGAAIAWLALAAHFVAPAFMRAVLEGPIATVAVLIGWTGLAAAAVVEGYGRRSGPRWRVGLGLVVLAAAQLHRVLVNGGHLPGDLLFAGLRLLGLVVVVTGLAQLVTRSVAALHSEQFQQQEELANAALHMERAAEIAAERDHELRNGLAGLAGITHLLSSSAAGEEQDRLKQAVLAELGRLHTILDGGTPEVADLGGPAAVRVRYDVEPVLSGLATLRRAAGTPIGLEIEPGLQACGDSAVLAQVVTNLIANCERHAPGAAVVIRACRRADEVVVEVRDEGPGLPAGAGDSLMRRGVRDAAAGGSGLGLHISRQLIEREGGTLDLRTVDDPRGMVATVTVPAATAPFNAPLNR
ncbi:sensor histidine kinase [Pseudonocardia nigra]|uniref:sensor histidine kinase n=1 Tax=Pseudonocardia nigra TaxID=1921578 RepID=UPI001C5DE30A|nr:HAMP domain-containing sensor histidine kinase [Pseudonocardia nigra]